MLFLILAAVAPGVAAAVVGVPLLILFGGIFLAIIAIIPIIVGNFMGGVNMQFGGTSLLIVVGVALETVKQLESQLTMRNYQGFLK